MTRSKKHVRNLIEGKPALIVTDIQKSTFIDNSQVRSIDNMPGYKERMIATRDLVDAAHENDIPVIFIQEVHRPDMIDFGRELDGDEDVHCLEGDQRTDIAKEKMGFREGDYAVPRRRCSALFGTDLEILLRGLRVDTLILCGGLTEVCVHYTFVDGHQSDYFCRVAEDCVGGSSVAAHEAAPKAMEYLQTGAIRPRSEMISAMSEHAGQR